MAIALAQPAIRSAANASSTTATYGSAATAGNLLVAAAYTNGNAGTMSITGWTKGIETAYSGTAQSVAIFYKLAAGGETGVTLNGATICRLHIAEFSGLSNPIVTDGTNSNAMTTVTTINTNSVTTTNADDLIIVASGTSTGETGTRGWDSSFSTLLDDATSFRLLSGYQIVASTGTYSSTATQGNTATNSGAVIMAFQATSTPPPTTITYITSRPPWIS